MFSNMKNKIREKTGTELPKFISNHNQICINHHSRQSSVSSLSSITSEQSLREEETYKTASNHNDTEPITPIFKVKESDLKNDVYKEGSKDVSHINWEKIHYKKEQEWNNKEKKYVSDLLKQNKDLQTALSLIEENKKKYVCCQEEQEQLMLHKKQEISKIEQLAAVNRESVTPKTDDVNECKLLKDEYSSLKQSFEEERTKFEELLSIEKEKCAKLNIENGQLKCNLDELKNMLEEEKTTKGNTIFRNAQISQRLQLTEQELERQQIQNDELYKKIADLEDLLDSSQKTVRRYQQQHVQNGGWLEFKLKESQDEVEDKNQCIKKLQQKLADMKKTLKQELKGSDVGAGNSQTTVENDINFQYMKHVLIKFLTSSDYEAQNLTRVVGKLLHLNDEEERLLRETLEWKMSWFGSRPHVKTESIYRTA